MLIMKKDFEIIFIETLRARAQVYNLLGKIDKALKDVKEGEKVAEKNNLIDNLAKLYMEKVVAYEILNDYDNMMLYAKKSSELFKSVDDLTGYANSLNSYAMALGSKGEYDRELEILQECYSILIKQYQINENGEKSRAGGALGFVLNNLGFVYKVKGDNEKSLNFYFESLKVRTEIDDKLAQAQSLNNIGMIYARNKDYENGILYLEKAKEILKKIGEKKMLSSVIYNIGYIYLFKNELDKSLEYFFESLPIKREIFDHSTEVLNLASIGVVYEKKGDYEKSIKYLKDAIRLRVKINFYQNIDKNFISLFESFKKSDRMKESFRYFLRLFEKFLKKENKEIIKILYDIILQHKDEKSLTEKVILFEQKYKNIFSQ
ncbi:MAG: tetratricopeptide repeat protein [candidate division WOR-3 bacterium]